MVRAMTQTIYALRVKSSQPTLFVAADNGQCASRAILTATAPRVWTNKAAAISALKRAVYYATDEQHKNLELVCVEIQTIQWRNIDV